MSSVTKGTDLGKESIAVQTGSRGDLADSPQEAAGSPFRAGKAVRGLSAAELLRVHRLFSHGCATSEGVRAAPTGPPGSCAGHSLSGIVTVCVCPSGAVLAVLALPSRYVNLRISFQYPQSNALGFRVDCVESADRAGELTP